MVGMEQIGKLPIRTKRPLKLKTLYSYATVDGIDPALLPRIIIRNIPYSSHSIGSLR